MKKSRRRARGKTSARPKELPPYGMRMKGGVLFDPMADGYIVIVHTWDNPHCHGEPEEWRHPQVFPTEEGAMQFYKSSIRPQLKQMMAEMEAKQSGASFVYRSLED